MNRQFDPGLQAQRTSLAWSRTALAMLVNALLVLRVGLQGEDRAVLGLSLVLGLLAAGLWRVSAWRRAALAGPQFRSVAPGVLATTALGVGVAAASACWAMLASA